MNRVISILVVLLFVALWVGCGSDDEEESEKLADFMVVSEIKGVTEFGTGYVKFTIENVGTVPAHNVSCTVYAKSGNTILDIGIAYFAVGGSILPGERAESDVTFLKLSSLANLTLEYEFKWDED